MSEQLRNVRDWDEEEKKLNEREKRKIFFSFALRSVVQGEGERERKKI
jgi:hypothetical protein